MLRSLHFNHHSKINDHFWLVVLKHSLFIYNLSGEKTLELMFAHLLIELMWEDGCVILCIRGIHQHVLMPTTVKCITD